MREGKNLGDRLSGCRLVQPHLEPEAPIGDKRRFFHPELVTARGLLTPSDQDQGAIALHLLENAELFPVCLPPSAGFPP